MTFQRFEPPGYRLEGAAEAPAGDRRDGKVYVYDDDIVLAVNVALATGRPLLVSGPPGSGKVVAREVRRERHRLALLRERRHLAHRRRATCSGRSTPSGA